MKIWFKIFCVFLFVTMSCSQQKADDAITVSRINSAFSDHNLIFPEGSIFLFLESGQGLTSNWANLKLKIPKDKLTTFRIKNGLSDFVKRTEAVTASHSKDPRWDLKRDVEVFESYKVVRDKINPDYPWSLSVIYKETRFKDYLTLYLSSIKHYN